MSPIQIRWAVVLRGVIIGDGIVQEVLVGRAGLEAGQGIADVGRGVLEGTPGAEFAGELHLKTLIARKTHRLNDGNGSEVSIPSSEGKSIHSRSRAQSVIGK